MVAMTESNKSSSIPFYYRPTASKSFHQRSDISPLESTPMKSHSIPISNSLVKTASEIQLCIDEQIAEHRDFMFYSRLKKGISQTQQEESHNKYLRRENQVFLTHITQTRVDSQRQLEEEGWSLGLSMDTPMNSEFLHSVATEAFFTTAKPDDDNEECFFELDM
jgi:hypothetical protein